MNEAQTHPLSCFDARSVHVFVLSIASDSLRFLIYEIHQWYNITLYNKINLVEKNNCFRKKEHGQTWNEIKRKQSRNRSAMEQKVFGTHER